MQEGAEGLLPGSGCTSSVVSAFCRETQCPQGEGRFYSQTEKLFPCHLPSQESYECSPFTKETKTKVSQHSGKKNHLRDLSPLKSEQIAG